MAEKRNNLFDFLRVLFSISVVISHASGIIYHTEIVSSNVAVDGFFMLAGLFMARHLYLRKSESPDRLFLYYQIERIKRLFPLCFILGSFVVLKELVRAHKFDILRWPSLYFMGNINDIPGFPVMWYVSALLWGGFLVSAFLIWRRKISILVFFPLIFFITFSFMYKYHNLWLYSAPLIKGVFSAGLVKSVCGLCVGAEVFYISQFLKNQKEKMRITARKILAILCELIFLYGFASSFWVWFSPKNFFVYLYVPLIMLVFLLDEQVIFKIFDFKIFSSLGKLTYAVYLTHIYLLNFLVKTKVCLEIPEVITYIALIPMTFFIGWISCKIEKLFLCLVRFLFYKK